MTKSEFYKTKEFRENLNIISDTEFNDLKIKRDEDINSLTEKEKNAYILYIENAQWEVYKFGAECLGMKFDEE